MTRTLPSFGTLARSVRKDKLNEIHPRKKYELPKPRIYTLRRCFDRIKVVQTPWKAGPSRAAPAPAPPPKSKASSAALRAIGLTETFTRGTPRPAPVFLRLRIRKAGGRAA
ncbi:hypothetical protein EVAR_8990_1 [Eumeta japonica]|uniref:Uncharacterized protein n=1 Tax=Eumeta variegata TaxID=151549 RepID=A0A4C1WQE6_EUMVA|nr:hypothetical protein EVAR_8990_1 [Eumeta japonica]